mmetsp:Transcript_10373/g.10241  ORF Transcript_10373/g.10241 Transcript_10373/m.10241 type:complete len:83 (+) Transcript_10373:182-430(+)|eukprot:CAMPEP_0197001754 /NCGR_PEP_ID=MMETSP1380-20130617/6373_1 /TAXON_ID=5936 /ORGANISM="Euplotes crassus, Strain CT5" /LENGTH=82 /DNA_ID=CAMNT_0042419539 /DNA_START=178 /DNA_END=426 /DNA_ORIENTATION=-
MKNFKGSVFSSVASDEVKYDTHQRGSLTIMKKKGRKNVASKFNSTKQESSNKWMVQDLGSQCMMSNGAIPNIKKRTLNHSFT